MASFERRSGKWLARIAINGNRLSRTFQTKAQAQAWASQVETEIRQGEYVTPSEHMMMDAIKKYAASVSPHKRGARWELIRLKAWEGLPFVNVRVTHVKTGMIAEWRDSRLKKVQPGTVNRELNLMSSIFEYARREWQWIKVNPVHDVRRPKNPPHRDRIISDPEISAILEALGYSEEVIYSRQQVIANAFLFALETAMRREEINGLEWDRVDIGGRHVKLAMTKNGEARKVPLSTKAIAILERMRPFKRPFDIDKDVLSTLFRRACIRAGITGIHFHDARRTALTRMALGGKLTPYEVAEIAGHKSLKMALVYFKADIKDMADKLN